ncbi:MAG: HlyC/CorC family transporter [Ardenticatenales bacterium]|nr:HlyC/CorC family transporter [Ardenticatenales bacterium]MCB9171343.1 HlyC/CorC family transporter [Ardenticatenales bacterium]
MLFNLLTIAFIVTLLIALNALYVAGEFAMVSSRKTRIRQSAKGGNRMARMLLPVLEDTSRLDRYIAGSQVGITLSSISLGIYGQNQLSPMVQRLMERLPVESAPWLGNLIAGGFSATAVLVLLTTLQVVLGELVPKSLAVQYPERVALATMIPMKISAEYILKPLIMILNGSGELIMRLLGLHLHSDHAHVHSPEEIEILVGESHRGGLIDAEERLLLHNAFRIGELSAHDVMVPRTRLVTASVDTSPADALALAAESSFTRIPIYEEDIDHIIGFVHLKDLLRLVRDEREGTLAEILRPVPHVPETAPATEIWNRLNEEHAYLAVVFDEYGGTAGLITQEDLIEELFGELQDEFDDELALVKMQEHGRFVLRGDVPIDYLNDMLGLSLPDEVAHSIGGLILNELGRLPTVGDQTKIGDITLTVESVNRRSVREVSLLVPERQRDTLPDDDATQRGPATPDK